MSTALVTGATAGLGAAFCRRLARDRMDLILVARDRERLELAAKELAAEHGIEVETLPADLSTDEGCARVADRLSDEDRPVDVLINNAGIGLGRSFLKASVEDGLRLTMLNVLAVQRLTHAALPPMIRRGRGDVVNVSSVAGFTPGRSDATYSASKAWVTCFSEALHAHTAGTGVRVMALCPGFVHTEFHQRAGINMSRLPELLWTDADDVVREGIHALRRGRAVCVPGWQYKTIVTLARHAPRFVVRRAAAKSGAPRR
ncbi:MAG: SDR family oxidoreductase [Mycobacteriales bacterium]